jgi:hypothetical protein
MGPDAVRRDLCVAMFVDDELARPERFERPTPRFVVWCSIQLSYGRAGFGGWMAGSGATHIEGCRVGQASLMVPGNEMSKRVPGVSGV